MANIFTADFLTSLRQEYDLDASSQASEDTALLDDVLWADLANLNDQNLQEAFARLDSIQKSNRASLYYQLIEECTNHINPDIQRYALIKQKQLYRSLLISTWGGLTLNTLLALLPTYMLTITTIILCRQILSPKRRCDLTDSYTFSDESLGCQATDSDIIVEKFLSTHKNPTSPATFCSFFCRLNTIGTCEELKSFREGLNEKIRKNEAAIAALLITHQP